MAEHHDKDSKTEEPTEKKIRDALEHGNTPFSREAGMLASLLGILIIFSFLLAGNVVTPQCGFAAAYRQSGRLASGEQRRCRRGCSRLSAWRWCRLLVPAVIVLAAAGRHLVVPAELAAYRVRPHPAQLSRLSLTQGWSDCGGKGQSNS